MIVLSSSNPSWGYRFNISWGRSFLRYRKGQHYGLWYLWKIKPWWCTWDRWCRAGISSGPGHGNLDSFEGWGGNVGLVGAKWLGGGFEFSVPKEWQDADGNLLFDVGGTLSGNKSLNKDAGVGYFGYVDVSKTGYFKRADNIGEMIDWLQGDGAKNSFPNLPQLGPRFIKGLTESILNIESQVNNLLTNGTGPRP